MPLPHLPDEVWENVIDHCRGRLDVDAYNARTRFGPVLQSYQDLRSCCLVCRAWVPRGRLGLHSTTILQSDLQVEELLRTLSIYPFLADHIHTLCVYSIRGHIAFARSELVQKLLRVRVLALHIDWEHYPPGYHYLAARYPVSELYLWGSFGASDNIGRVVLAFRNIERFHFDPDPQRGTIPTRVTRARPLDPTRTRQGKSRFPTTITSLEIGPYLLPPSNFRSWITHITSVADLTLKWDNYYPIGQAADAKAPPILNYISSLHHLRSLTLQLASYRRHPQGDDDEALSTWIAGALWQIRQSRVRLLRVRFRPDGTDRRNFPISRHAFLAKVVTPEFDYVVGHTRTLREVAFEIDVEADGGDTSGWWKEEIRRRLPRMPATVSVVLRPRSSKTRNQPLWIAMGRDRETHPPGIGRGMDDSSGTDGNCAHP
ncbi:hypothetical protein C8Q78DRAFT_710435 [Trametes maxima]|nr:hypothetical protein C8Q78DRAFT_710435 [Trametes maxima]